MVDNIFTGYRKKRGKHCVIDNELEEAIKNLQDDLEQIYGKKVSFRSASKIYVGFKNVK